MGRRGGRRGSRRRGGIRKQRRGSNWQAIKNLVLIIGFVGMMAGLMFSGGGASDSPDAPADTDAVEDADQDRIPDSWERAGNTAGGAPLPGADPNQMDLYVQVVSANNVQPLTDRERSQLQTIWAEMSVGSDASGIDLHFVDTQQLDESITIEGSPGDFDDLKSEYYSTIAPEACVYHTVMLVDVTGEDVAGRGHAPGYFLFADGTLLGSSTYTHRVTSITHELLHNVIGEFDGGYVHTTEGWLSTDYDTYLSERTREHLNSTGLSKAKSYDGCDVP